MKFSFKILATLASYAILINASPIAERDAKPTTTQPGIVCGVLGDTNCPISIVPPPTSTIIHIGGPGPVKPHTTSTLHIGGPGPVRPHTTPLPAKRSGIVCGVEEGPGGPNCSLGFHPLPTTTSLLNIGGPGPVKPPTTTLHIGGPGPVKPHTTTIILPPNSPNKRSTNRCGEDGPECISPIPLPTTTAPTTTLSIGGPGPVKPHTTEIIIPPFQTSPSTGSGIYCGAEELAGPICSLPHSPLPTPTTTGL